MKILIALLLGAALLATSALAEPQTPKKGPSCKYLAASAKRVPKDEALTPLKGRMGAPSKRCPSTCAVLQNEVSKDPKLTELWCRCPDKPLKYLCTADF